jgi:NadR type nicotinamide-nucleotide adenylyltransferase
MESKETKPPIKIAIVGPESTGKSVLTQALAVHFKGLWVPEAAREYLEKLARPYQKGDVEEIARLQIQAEKEALKSQVPIVFCDTNLLVIKVWMEHRFGTCPTWILDSLSDYRYDLSLLCDIDLNWEPDPLREHPHLRNHFRKVYENELTNLNCKWNWVRGYGQQRMETAISQITFFLHSGLDK